MNKVNKNKGFTLLELIVAMGLFAVVLTATINIFVLSIRAQRTVIAEKRVAENVNFALEFMSRQMRTALRDNSGSCGVADQTFTAATSSEIRFITTDLECIHIFLSNSTIMYENVTNNPGVNVPLTDISAVIIDDLNFALQGESVSDNEQPRVRMVIDASVTVAGIGERAMRLQTTVSSRNLDVPGAGGAN